jgi:curved DNA-binding protein CbpA
VAAEDSALSTTEKATLDRLHIVVQSGDHYEILGVEDAAERMDIQQAYYTLSRKWHPDRFFRVDLGEYTDRLETVFIAITEAYRVLSNDAARRAYDVQRESKGGRRRRSKRSKTPSEPMSEQLQAAVEADSERSRRRSSRREGRAAGRRRVSGDKQPRRPSSRAKGSRSGRTPGMSKAIADMRKNLRVQLRRAREMFAEGEQHMEAGAIMKAASAYTMASTFDPKNDEYREAAESAQRAARKLQAKNFVQLAESAESFANLREALANYQKAVEYEVDEARPYYRLGMLLRRIEEDHRAALEHFRTAVKMAPNNVEFRLALGDLYADLGLKVNAQGQFKRVLAMEKGNEKAKAALRYL